MSSYITLPPGASALPPAQGGPRIRLWDRDFNLIVDTAVTSQSWNDLMADLAHAYLTVDEDGQRQTFGMIEITRANWVVERNEGQP